jgi:putative salt-induced outer membrane protein
MFKKPLLLLVCVVSFSYGFISLEPPVIGEKKGLDGEVSIGGVYNSGNTDSSAANFGLKGEYHEEVWMLYSIASYAYGEANGDKNKNNGLMHLRYIHNIEDTLYDYELFVQTEFNEFQDVKMRNLAGANVRRKFEDFFDKCYVGVGLFYSYMEPDVISTIDPIYERVKLNTYLSFTKSVNEHFEVTYLGFYQPNIEDFSDYRIFQILQLDTMLTDNLSLGFDISHKYNATPYHNIEKTDISSMISLKYKLK